MVTLHCLYIYQWLQCLLLLVTCKMVTKTLKFGRWSLMLNMSTVSLYTNGYNDQYEYSLYTNGYNALEDDLEDGN